MVPVYVYPDMHDGCRDGSHREDEELPAVGGRHHLAGRAHHQQQQAQTGQKQLRERDHEQKEGYA